MNWTELFNKKGKSDLAKVKRILRSLKLDLSKVKILSVVGTNGKGSVANYVAQGLIHKKRNVGLFTSPHILKPNERIKINNKEITDIEVEEILNEFPQFKNFMFFSVMFLIAIVYFIKNKVDVIILEAGVGGLKDSTNAVKANYGVVTSIGMDHTKFLGNNVYSIAKDKAGIINKGMTFYIPTKIQNSLQDIFIAKVMRTPGSSFRMINNLSKRYSERNKMLAQSILKLSFNILVPLTFFKEISGRTEIFVNDNGTVNIYDVGHNYQAIKAVLKELEQKRIHINNVVIGMLNRKDKSGIKELLKHKNVFIHQLNKEFYSAKDWEIKEVKDIDHLKLEGNTLYIGSFYFIGALYDKFKN